MITISMESKDLAELVKELCAPGCEPNAHSTENDRSALANTIRDILCEQVVQHQPKGDPIENSIQALIDDIRALIQNVIDHGSMSEAEMDRRREIHEKVKADLFPKS